MAKHNETGAKGEVIAADYLRGLGYQILATNWRFGHKEVDILAAVGDLLIVIEVKTRSGIGYGFPEESVTAAKQNMLRAAATAYLEQNPGFLQVRFDIVSLIITQDKIKELLHLQDAFCDR